MGTSADDRTKRERDLYLGLLHLYEEPSVDAFLDAALEQVVRLAEAARGHIRLFDGGNEGAAPTWSATGCSAEELAGLYAGVSRGIVDLVRRGGRTFHTVDATVEPALAGRRSVEEHDIRNVLCVPIGRPVVGVIYLQRRPDAGPFGEDEIELVERFARHLAPAATTHGRPFAAAVVDATTTVRDRFPAPGLVGRSPALARVLAQANIAARVPVNVLVRGATGTGKTALARLIHANGPRAAGPFVELNCAALPADLVESELFGHERGAHSTAHETRPGKVAAAERGVLFLDEIGELPVAVQAKLLKLVEDKRYYRLGGIDERRADVRIIAATNIDLSAAVAERRFRADLLYRLERVPIRMPGLDERREDVPLLAEHFCRRACDELAIPPLPLDTAAVWALTVAEWPGHVRELASRVARAVYAAHSAGAPSVRPVHLFADEHHAVAPRRLDFRAATLEFQGRLLADAWTASGRSATRTAEALGLSRSRTYELLEAHGLTTETR